MRLRRRHGTWWLGLEGKLDDGRAWCVGVDLGVWRGRPTLRALRSRLSVLRKIYARGPQTERAAP